MAPSSPLRPAGWDKVFFRLGLGNSQYCLLPQASLLPAHSRQLSPQLTRRHSFTTPPVHPPVPCMVQATVLLTSHSRAGSRLAAACFPSPAVPKILSINSQGIARPRLKSVLDVNFWWAVMLRSWKFKDGVSQTSPWHLQSKKIWHRLWEYKKQTKKNN